MADPRLARERRGAKGAEWRGVDSVTAPRTTELTLSGSARLPRPGFHTARLPWKGIATRYY
jgi:hypothetical protein